MDATTTLFFALFAQWEVGIFFVGFVSSFPPPTEFGGSQPNNMSSFYPKADRIRVDEFCHAPTHMAFR